MRHRKDGSPAARPRRHRFNPIFIKTLRGEPKPFIIWDTTQRGFALVVQPSGYRSYKSVYSKNGRSRWYHIGSADDLPLADARHVAAEIRRSAALGKDPVAERQAERDDGTFGELALRYRDEVAKQKNRSWKKAARHVERHAIPRWSKLLMKDITRTDVRKMMASITAPMLANQTLAACSAIFAWAIKQDIITTANPCRGVERHATTARERVLSDAEIPAFWAAFDNEGLIASSALKCLLLSGQRPGEVAHMRHEHVIGEWWEMPGAQQANWPGTKNGQSHRIYLSRPVRAIIGELDQVKSGFVFGAGPRGRPIGTLSRSMQRVCTALGVERATAHDLRRTFLTRVTKLGFGRDAMNRVSNHREGGVTDVYDRHEYEAENKAIMEGVAAHLLTLVTGETATNVLAFIKQ